MIMTIIMIMIMIMVMVMVMIIMVMVMIIIILAFILNYSCLTLLHYLLHIFILFLIVQLTMDDVSSETCFD